MPRFKDTNGWKKAGAKRINKKVALPFIPEYLPIIQNAKAAGGSDNDIAFLLGTNRTNFNNWKKLYPELKKIRGRGKELTRVQLVGQGLKQASGYTIKDKTIEYIGIEDENGNIVPESKDGKKKYKVKEVIKELPGNPQLLMFLLSSLERDLGRDTFINRHFIDKKVEETITHKIDTKSISDQIDRLSGSYTKYVGSKEAEFESKRLPENKQESKDTVASNS
ncbi:MAG: hypothetical protein ACFFG0_38845 [Candidatus Thorarchaeota archaeon]